MSAPTDSSDPAAQLRRAIRPAVGFAWSLLAGLLAGLVLEELIRSRFRPFLGFARLTDRLSVRYGFYLAAAAFVVAIRVLNAAGLRRIKPAEPEVLLRRLRRLAVLTLAAAEMPALLGLALFLIGGYNVDFSMLTFVSLVLLFMYFPRPRAWEAHLENAPPACPF